MADSPEQQAAPLPDFSAAMTSGGLASSTMPCSSSGGIAADTNVLPVYLFRQGIGKFGETSAIGMLIVIIMLAISWYNIRLLLKEDEQ